MQNRTMSDMYNLRLPNGLREVIKDSARRNQRSMNAEIIFHLSTVFTETETKKADARA